MSLSKRELTIAERYAEGDTYKEIAARYHIAPSTVRNHLAAIYRKLEVGNKPALIRALSSAGAAGDGVPPPEVAAPSLALMRNLGPDGPPPASSPSIAVMPFATLGPENSDHVGHGIAADIQHDLTRSHDLLVSGRSSCMALYERVLDPAIVARQLGVHYVLQGSVRVQRDRLRLTAELVEGETGTLLWSARYDRALADILDVEAEIALAVAGGLTIEIEAAQHRRRGRLPADHLTAYDWRLRGNRCLEQSGATNLRKAKACFTRALELEPESAAAQAGLSIAFGYECDLLLARDYGASLEHHIAHAEAALALDESDSRGHYAMSCAMMLTGRFELADQHAARGLELNPSEYHNLCNRGYTYMALGRFADSVAIFDESLRRNPLASNSCLMAVALIEYLVSNYGQSANALTRMTAPYVQRASTLAAACAQSGHGATARAAALEFQRLRGRLPESPKGRKRAEWRAFWRKAYPYLEDDAFAHMLEGIGKAELPV